MDAELLIDGPVVRQDFLQQNRRRMRTRVIFQVGDEIGGDASRGSRVAPSSAAIEALRHWFAPAPVFILNEDA